eukprot:351631-Chlamydomonas_euryale.AAC.5
MDSSCILATWPRRVSCAALRMCISWGTPAAAHIRAIGCRVPSGHMPMLVIRHRYALWARTSGCSCWSVRLLVSGTACRRAGTT